MKLTVVARILAKQEHQELVKNELIKLIDITRKEAGCINYDLHQDNENPNLFLFYENWTSREIVARSYEQPTFDRLHESNRWSG